MILQGDAIERLRELPDRSAQTCITSPPYYGLRDYGTGEWEGGDAECQHLVRENPRVESSGLAGGTATTGHQREGYRDSCPRCGATRTDQQLGLEPTPDAYVAKLVAVFREVRRVLRDDGTLWLNLGDSYNAAGRVGHGTRIGFKQGTNRASATGQDASRANDPSLKEKDLLGIPWMVAFALRADGWYLRSEIIWAKPNPMPESVTDRPTKAHEQVFLLSKSARYYYDGEAIREDRDSELRPSGPTGTRGRQGWSAAHIGQPQQDNVGGVGGHIVGRNKRSVWTVATQPYAEAHFATFPPKLIEPMVLAGCAAGGTVLDPFAGAGTTLKVAVERGRSAIGIELNPEYVQLAERRLAGVTPPLFA